MALLRDLRESTRLLFLHEIIANRHSRLRTIAERLGMTIQGASEYARGLQADGLMTVSEGEYRATKTGVEVLLDGVRELRGFVDQAGRSLAFVETTAAVAGGDLRRGDRVGLFMESGVLVAYPGRSSPSVGIADRDADRGEDVPVRDLEGIVALAPGRVVLARVPSIREGGSRAIRPDRARKVTSKTKGFLVAGIDATGLAAARRLRLRPTIEFGVLPAAIDAAERGLDVLLFVPEERAAEAVATIEGANAKLEEPIAYESVALG